MPCATHPDVLTGLAACTRCGRDFCPDCIITLKGAVVCAGCKADVVQDVKSGVVAGELALASRGARLVAILIDQFVVGFVMVVIMVLAFFALVGTSGLAGMNKGGGGMPLPFTIIYFATVLILPTLYEAFLLAKGGQTLGKRALRLKVVRDDGSDISAGQAWGRAVSRTLMGFTGILAIIDILMIFSASRTCLHDRTAKTRVVTWKR
jgi:uncharacterized RDD family membrane protein YckC